MGQIVEDDTHIPTLHREVLHHSHLSVKCDIGQFRRFLVPDGYDDGALHHAHFSDRADDLGTWTRHAGPRMPGIDPRQSANRSRVSYWLAAIVCRNRMSETAKNRPLSAAITSMFVQTVSNPAPR